MRGMNTLRFLGSAHLRKRCNYNANIFRSIVQVTADSAKQEVHEVTIPVPWGYVAGKWWGEKNSKERPILAIHGWQDNAGSFDNLVEHMNTNRPILAIDMPGHGWSSPIYPTMVYHDIDTVLLVRRIQKHYSWDKVTLLTHAMGGITAFLYASLYPEYVDATINLDVFKPIESELFTRADVMSSSIDKIIDLMKRIPSQSGCTSTELRNRWISASRDSLTKDSAEILMRRGIKEINPNRFIFSRDIRLKAPQLQTFESSENLKLAKNINCHVLLVYSDDCKFYNMCTAKCPGVIDILGKNAKSFEMHTVNGTHHFHLNNPETVAPIINSFLERIN